MRKVMIGTPCYDGRLDVWYTNSLVNTIKLASHHEVEITPIWISFDALIQRARNDIVQIALEEDFDDLIWIDSDIEWNPEWVFKLLNYSVDVVGGTYPKKSDQEEYVIRQTQHRHIDKNTGLVEVDGLGTGFVRMSKLALQHLWNVSPSYIDSKDNKERRMIFNVVINNDQMISEDIYMFNNLRSGGISVYFDPTMTCAHIGPKKWQGDFMQWSSIATKLQNVIKSSKTYKQL